MYPTLDKKYFTLLYFTRILMILNLIKSFSSTLKIVLLIAQVIVDLFKAKWLRQSYLTFKESNPIYL